LTQIVAQVPDHMMEVPTDALDFLDFDRKSPEGLPILMAKYCPFCGKQLIRQ